MRIILIFFLLITTIGNNVISQAARKKAASSDRAVPAKSEIQSQMNEAIGGIKKEIAELEKQLKAETDEETIKDLKEQIAMLQKQLNMMKSLNKNVAMMSEETVQQAADDDGSATAPKRDMTRISMLPKQVLTEAELLLFIKNVQAGVEKIIPAAEKIEALKIYNETKNEHKSIAVVANAASGCWMLGHWEKALLIMGKVCVDDMSDADNLNNYAAFLIMTGGEQAAVPILEYLNEKYPENSTILNNIGQAWFGLGDIDKAKKYLDETKALYPNHSMANNTLANIHEVEGDNDKAISFLKASLKENYDPEKETQLKRLGYEIKFADMPPLNYPMEKDPFGFIPLINSWDPNKIQTSVDAPEGAFALQRYTLGVRNFNGELLDEDVELDKELQVRLKKIPNNPSYREKLLKPYHDSPAHLVAAKSLELYCLEQASLCLKKPQSSSPLAIGLLLPVQRPTMDKKMFKPVAELVADCERIWVRDVMEPLSKLDKALTSTSGNTGCRDLDARMNAYLAKQKDIYTKGIKLIQAEFQNQSPAVTNYIKYAMYADIDEPDIPAGTSAEDFLLDNPWLIAEIDRSFIRKRNRNKYYRNINSLLLKGQHFQQRYKSACNQNTEPEVIAEMNGDDLLSYKVKKLKCEYIKKVITPVKYKFVLYCNNFFEEYDPNLPKKKVDLQIGKVHVTKSGNSSKGPITGPRGPNILINELEQPETFYQPGPLTSEYKDISQFSLEYNKWGNLVGFNFQLSEDGSTLKDPDSIESGVDSRWSWNAIASSKKSYLNQLNVK
ncbi:MAG TPA: tetratricopeptide repeat protein [Chitinophagaceae bacterium]|nr:tetratricopeptide repeat protein [Chitinophagaceae bacterium]